MKSPHFFLVLAMMLSFSLVAVAQSDDLSVKQGNKEILAFKKTANGYMATSTTLLLDIVKVPTGYTLVMGGKEYKIQEKENSLKIYDPAGNMIYKIKEKTGKIKILGSGIEQTLWAIKIKDDHYTVLSGEQEIGKIKLYKEDKKIKVKDKKGNEICEATANRLYSAPAVTVFEGLAEKDLLILFAALALYNK